MAWTRRASVGARPPSTSRPMCAAVAAAAAFAVAGLVELQVACGQPKIFSNLGEIEIIEKQKIFSASIEERGVRNSLLSST